MGGDCYLCRVRTCIALLTSSVVSPTASTRTSSLTSRSRPTARLPAKCRAPRARDLRIGCHGRVRAAGANIAVPTGGCRSGRCWRPAMGDSLASDEPLRLTVERIDSGATPGCRSELRPETVDEPIEFEVEGLGRVEVDEVPGSWYLHELRLGHELSQVFRAGWPSRCGRSCRPSWAARPLCPESRTHPGTRSRPGARWPPQCRRTPCAQRRCASRRRYDPSASRSCQPAPAIRRRPASFPRPITTTRNRTTLPDASPITDATAHRSPPSRRTIGRFRWPCGKRSGVGFAVCPAVGPRRACGHLRPSCVGAVPAWFSSA